MRLTKGLFLGLAAAVAITGLTVTVLADHHEGDKDKTKPKDIHDVMEWGHKGRDSIATHVKDGKGTAAEIDLLVIYYKLMAKSKPPEGDIKSWKEKTDALVTAINGVKKKSPDAVAKYKEAVNCKACHTPHKPKDD